MHFSYAKYWKPAMMKINLQSLAAILVTLCIFLRVPATVSAASKLIFEPDVIKAQQNKTFDVIIKIDTERESAFGSDVTVLYPHTDLELTNVLQGDFFRDFQYANNNDGRLELHGFFSSLNETKSGAGTFATLTFKSKQTSGGGAVSFICTGSTNDSQIINAQGQNILSCNAVNRLDLTYLPPITNTPSPTPTGIPSSNKNPVCTSLIVNPISATFIPLNVTLTCTGRDDDGDITAAEFIFGDGKNQIITKNVGSPGSLTTTHTYTNTGSMNATCRLRDNNNTFSTTNSSCSKTISLSSSASISVTATLTPTPTTQIVDLQATPTPTEEAYIPPTGNPTPATPITTTTDNYPQAWILLLVLWIVALVLAFLYYRKRRRPRGPVLYNKD